MTAVVDKYNYRVERVNSLVCVGLDPDPDKLPRAFRTSMTPFFDFNRWIIEQTHHYAAAYKPNMAFYEAHGEAGLRDLKLTMEYLRAQHPDILTICDAKRGDIGSTNIGYMQAVFDWLGADAVTLHPYLGGEALSPFLSRVDKGCIILCRTSNPGSSEFQNLHVNGKPLWQMVAEYARDQWNIHGNCMLVVGATYPEEVRAVREITGDMTLLIPGIGAQGGSVEQTVRAGLNRAGKGLIVNSSRGIIYAEDPAYAARELRDAINEFR